MRWELGGLGCKLIIGCGLVRGAWLNIYISIELSDLWMIITEGKSGKNRRRGCDTC